jgi:hypothetical protein
MARKCASRFLHTARAALGTEEKRHPPEHQGYKQAGASAACATLTP